MARRIPKGWRRTRTRMKDGSPVLEREPRARDISYPTRIDGEVVRPYEGPGGKDIPRLGKDETGGSKAGKAAL